MKRNYILSLLVVTMLVPFTTLKAQFHPGDSLAIQNIMATNFTANTALNWNDPNPLNWIGVIWDANNPQRIVSLNLNESTCNGNNNGTFSPTGVDIELTGVLDLTALAELQILEFRRDTNITGVNVTGLNNLTTLTGSRSGLITLDVSGLTSLTTLRVKQTTAMTDLNSSNCPALFLASLRGNQAALNLNFSGSTSLNKIACPQGGVIALDASGCIALDRIRGGNNAIASADLTGCVLLRECELSDNQISSLANIPGLSGLAGLEELELASNQFFGTVTFPTINNAMIESILIRDNVNLTGLDVSALTNVEELIARDCSISTFTGTMSLEKLALSNNQLTTIDVTGLNNLASLGLKNNLLTNIIGIETLGGLTQMNANENKMELTQAVQASLVPVSRSAGSSSNGVENQDPYTNIERFIPDSIEYAPHDLIDVNGTNVATTFQLFDSSALPLGPSNTTGKFTFLTPMDVGTYFVEMENSGVRILTKSISVAECLTTVDVTTTTVNGVGIIANQVGATYQWIDCDLNAPIAGETSKNFIATGGGNYSVIVTDGCASDTSLCVNITLVGINEVNSGASVSVYPNPMNDIVTIELEEAVKNTQISIVNVEGKTVYNNIVNTSKLTVDGADWNNGIYIVKITNDEYTKTLKIIK